LIRFFNFTPENHIAIDRIPQYERQDDDHSPEGEAQGFLLCRRFPKGDTGRDGIRVNRGDETKVSREIKDDAGKKGQDITPGFQALDKSIEGYQTQYGEGPDKIDSGGTKPVF